MPEQFFALAVEDEASRAASEAKQAKVMRRRIEAAEVTTAPADDYGVTLIVVFREHAGAGCHMSDALSIG